MPIYGLLFLQPLLDMIFCISQRPHPALKIVLAHLGMIRQTAQLHVPGAVHQAKNGRQDGLGNLGGRLHGCYYLMPKAHHFATRNLWACRKAWTMLWCCSPVCLFLQASCVLMLPEKMPSFRCLVSTLQHIQLSTASLRDPCVLHWLLWPSFV